MAVTAVFQADFTSFDAGVKGAEAGLKTLEGTSRGTEAQLQQMTVTAGAGAGPAQSLTLAYRQFDGVLASAGINIGPYVKGLEDIAAAAGKTSTQLGALGTAGAVLGVAITGWKIGTAIDDFFGLSEAAVEAMEAFYGYGSAIETAGAKQDVINRAIAQGAVETIAYTEAIKFNQEALLNRNAKAIDWTGTLADAQREVRNLSEAEERGIEIAQRAGATVEEISRKYGISALALKELGERKKVTSDQAEAHAKSLGTEAAAVAKLDAEYAKLMSDTANAAGMAQMEADASDLAWAAEQKRIESLRALNRVRDEADAQAADLATQEQQLEADYQATVEAVQDVGAAHTETAAAAVAATQQTVAGYQMVSAQVVKTAEEARARIAMYQFDAAANAILRRNSLYTSPGQLEQIANLPLPAALQGGGGGGFGGTVNNTFNLTDTESGLARRVSEEIMRTVRSGTQVGTA